MQVCNNGNPQPCGARRRLWAVGLAGLVLLTQAACSTSGRVAGERGARSAVYGHAGLTREQVREADQQFERGLAALRERRHDEARDIFQLLSEAYPALSGPVTNLGILNAQGRDAGRALQDFTRAVEANPRNAVAFNWLGVLHREQGAYGLAEQAYKKAIALDADYAAAYRNLGLLYDLYLKRPEAAIAQYQHYLERTQGDDLIVRVWIKELEAQGVSTASLPVMGVMP